MPIPKVTQTTDISRARSELRRDIAFSLGLDPDKLPALLDAEQAAKVLDNSPQTLSIWRSTKRYNLPYVKIGRRVKYRVSDLLDFIERRTHGVTMEG
ncbi:helix-turn-helix domain-containing protein [Thermithiobacillus plumbiphilus]|uniref:Helix-turn-helix domain-containing protein n=1 Tax=Thermithiobacillus plumbiphilus TaxID=1729899 RepID=A0ABU9D620_9PROT